MVECSLIAHFENLSTAISTYIFVKSITSICSIYTLKYTQINGLKGLKVIINFEHY